MDWRYRIALWMKVFNIRDSVTIGIQREDAIIGQQSDNNVIGI